MFEHPHRQPDDPEMQSDAAETLASVIARWQLRFAIGPSAGHLAI
jgi:hypothetical protein